MGVSEITIGRKKVILWWCVDHQVKMLNRFIPFWKSLKLPLKLNCRSDNWWVGDEVTTESTKLSEVIDSYCLNQRTDELTHILPNSLSCIDLIITDQPNLIVDFGAVHPSLYSKSHHQLFLVLLTCLFQSNPHINEPFGDMINLN